MRDTSHIGEVSRTQVIAALARSGKHILVPLADHQRYDLVIDEGGRFLRVQVKTGRLQSGAVIFNPCSIDSRSKAGGCVRKGYADQIEFFGVYCPETNKCYLVPVGDAPTKNCSLRIDPPQNGQKTRIRWAGPFEIGEGVELAGFEPATS